MATDIVQSLFGITPDSYRQQQAALADAQALQYAKLDPFQQANYAIGRGAYDLAGAIGGALGGQDPELQRITMRQQIAGQLNPNDPTTFDRGIQMLRQSGDGQGALMLQMEADKARQRAQEAQLNTLKTEDFLTARGQSMQARGLDKLASELVAKMKKPDGTLDQEVVNKLRSFPQGIAAISAQAKILPDLRRLGATGTTEVDPFAAFTLDETIPKNVQTYAKQLSKSFTDGVLDPEKVDVRVKELSEMTQRAQQFQQNQDQIKAQQEQTNSFKEQGLANSTAALELAKSTKRLQEDNARFQQDMKTAEVARKEEERKNKPLPSYLAKEEETDYSTAQAATNLAFDAFSFINRIKQGEIKFGLKDKASIRARQAFGSKDPDVIAREDYDKFLTVLVNESLRLNKGTQTEGDAVRAAKELQSSESPEAAASAMNRLLNINVRRTQNSADEVLRRRKNAGFPDPVRPVDVPKFDVQIITPAEYNSFLKNPKFPSGTIFVDPEGVKRKKP
jgi:hypothetical protein